MKKAFIFITFCINVLLVAQTKEIYQSEMDKIIISIDSLTSEAEVTDIKNRLARVNKSFPDEWQPLYYSAYTDLRSFFIKSDDDISVLDDAVEKIKKALAMKGADKSELWALQGYIMMMEISTDPMNLGVTLATDTYNILEKAIKENPENPRPRLVLLILNLGERLYFKDSISSECEQVPEMQILIESEHKKPLSPKWADSLLGYVRKKCIQ